VDNTFDAFLENKTKKRESERSDGGKGDTK
jgi:hypothetical protein